jgi:hypothetical protein
MAEKNDHHGRVQRSEQIQIRGTGPEPPVEELLNSPKKPPVKEPKDLPQKPLPPAHPPVQEPPDEPRKPPVEEPLPEDPNQTPPLPSVRKAGRSK